MCGCKAMPAGCAALVHVLFCSNPACTYIFVQSVSRPFQTKIPVLNATKKLQNTLEFTQHETNSNN